MEKLKNAMCVIMQYCKEHEDCKNCKFLGYGGLCGFKLTHPFDWDDLLEEGK